MKVLFVMCVAGALIVGASILLVGPAENRGVVALLASIPFIIGARVAWRHLRTNRSTEATQIGQARPR